MNEDINAVTVEVKTIERRLLEELDWVHSATDKEIEDEKLILNEQLDEIAEQLKSPIRRDNSWAHRAIQAAKFKRKKLKLLLKLTGGEPDHVCLSGELKHKFDVLTAQNLALEDKVTKLKKQVSTLQDKLYKQRLQQKHSTKS